MSFLWGLRAADIMLEMHNAGEMAGLLNPA